MKNILTTSIIAIIFLLLSSCNSAACDQCVRYMPSVTMDSNDGGLADHATNTSLMPSIVLKFNQPFSSTEINQKSIILSTKPIIDNNPVLPTNKITISQIVSNNSNTVFSFHPVKPLNPNTKYYIIINGNIGLSNHIIYYATATQFSFTTGSNLYPTVNILDPENSSTNTSLTPNIMVQFSDNVLYVNNKNVLLYENSLDGTQILLGNITEGANNTYHINLKAPLKKSTTYYIFFSNFITNNLGNQLRQTSFSFTTGNNTIPSVNMLYPSNNSSDSSQSPVIQLQFSSAVKNVNSDNIILSSDFSGNNHIAISKIIVGDNNTYTFSPLKPLTPGNIYYLIVKSGISNLDNINIQNTTFNFTAGNSTSPTVNMISPSNNANNVTNYPTLKFQFSQAVQNVNQDNVIMYQSSVGGTQVPISIQSSADNIYTITPVSPIDSATTFYIVFSSSIIGNNNAVLMPTTFTFTTSDRKIIFVTATSFTGDLTTLGGKPTIEQSADYLCNIDSAKPSTSALFTYKALILTNNRVPTNPNVWALQPNSNYYNTANQIIGATSTNATLPDTLSNPISTSNIQVWTGSEDNTPWQTPTSGALYCNNWSSTTIGIGFTGIASSLTNYFSGGDPGYVNCSNKAHLYCVEQ